VFIIVSLHNTYNKKNIAASWCTTKIEIRSLENMILLGGATTTKLLFTRYIRGIYNIDDITIVFQEGPKAGPGGLYFPLNFQVVKTLL